MSGELGDGPSPSALERTEMFHTDSVLCGLSALARITSQRPHRIALDYPMEDGALVFGDKRRVRPEKVAFFLSLRFSGFAHPPPKLVQTICLFTIQRHIPQQASTTARKKINCTVHHIHPRTHVCTVHSHSQNKSTVNTQKKQKKGGSCRQSENWNKMQNSAEQISSRKRNLVSIRTIC